LGEFVSCKALIVPENNFERLKGIGFNAFKTIWQKGNGAEIRPSGQGFAVLRPRPKIEQSKVEQ
jgi:hypothetical protein